MTKKILDHAEQTAEGSRVERFTGFQRAEAPSAAAKHLERRNREEPADQSRAQEFLRIERENTA